MDGQSDGETGREKREVHDAKDRYKRQVDRCSAEHLCMSKQRTVCMGEIQREGLMDGLVYTAGGVQGGGEGEICVLRGGHGWGDVIDLTGTMSPEERERER